MAANKRIGVQAAIELLKSGASIEGVIIADLTSAKVNAMDALLLAENGYIVPDESIVYDDDDIEYDSDFDEVLWDKSLPFSHIKDSFASEDVLSETAELVVQLQVRNSDMMQWLSQNKAQLNFVISNLLESMYEAERLPKILK